MQIKILALAATLVFTPVSIFAQSTATANPQQRNINQRKENQQDRIGQGVTNGQLTARETSHLEHQEAGINKEERGMRAQDNGHLTRQDRRTLRHQQNHESKRIRRDKHNARTGPR